MNIEELDLQALEQKSKEEILDTLRNAKYATQVEKYDERYSRDDLLDMIRDLEFVRDSDVGDTVIAKPGVIKLLMYAGVLPKGETSSKEIDEQDLGILMLLEQRGTLTKEELCELTNHDDNELDRRVKKLARQGEVFYPETTENSYSVAAV